MSATHRSSHKELASHECASLEMAAACVGILAVRFKPIPLRGVGKVT